MVSVVRRLQRWKSLGEIQNRKYIILRVWSVEKKGIDIRWVKKIWILNHYATVALEQRGGRHYWMAKELVKKGYQPVVFCANTVHNSDCSAEQKEKYVLKKQDDITFVIVKSTPYKGNGISRIRNILSFYRNVKNVAGKYAKLDGKPYAILASSVHPLACVAGIQLGKK